MLEDYVKGSERVKGCCYTVSPVEVPVLCAAELCPWRSSACVCFPACVFSDQPGEPERGGGRTSRSRTAQAARRPEPSRSPRSPSGASVLGPEPPAEDSWSRRSGARCTDPAGEERTGEKERRREERKRGQKTRRGPERSSRRACLPRPGGPSRGRGDAFSPELRQNLNGRALLKPRFGTIVRIRNVK